MAFVTLISHFLHKQSSRQKDKFVYVDRVMQGEVTISVTWIICLFPTVFLELKNTHHHPLHTRCLCSSTPSSSPKSRHFTLSMAEAHKCKTTTSRSYSLFWWSCNLNREKITLLAHFTEVELKSRQIKDLYILRHFTVLLSSMLCVVCLFRLQLIKTGLSLICVYRLPNTKKP